MNGGTSQEEWERLKNLERKGVVKLGSGGIPEGFWELPMPADPDGLVRQALLEDREERRTCQDTGISES